jgi:hypothetical protein
MLNGAFLTDQWSSLMNHTDPSIVGDFLELNHIIHDFVIESVDVLDNDEGTEKCNSDGNSRKA